MQRPPYPLSLNIESLIMHIMSARAYPGVLVPGLSSLGARPGTTCTGIDKPLANAPPASAPGAHPRVMSNADADGAALDAYSSVVVRVAAAVSPAVAAVTARSARGVGLGSATVVSAE